MSFMSAELIDCMGNDLMVANVARVSLNKHHEAFEPGDERLIVYLAKHKHITPFFHPQVQIRLQAPIFVARQWFRSVIGVGRNEVSKRYVDDIPECFFPDSWRARPEASIKQGSGDDLSAADQNEADAIYGQAIDTCLRAYDELLKLNVAPEQARMVLPQSMFTQWVETGSLAYWARVCKLRLDGHAQKEIRDLAQQVSEVIKPLFPVSWGALMEYGV